LDVEDQKVAALQEQCEMLERIAAVGEKLQGLDRAVVEIADAIAPIAELAQGIAELMPMVVCAIAGGAAPRPATDDEKQVDLEDYLASKGETHE
jgi:hypothetical protein